MKPNDRFRLSRFEVGDSVRVRSGPFESFDGVVEEINWERMKLQVVIEVFGRRTVIELSADEVEQV